MDLIESQSNCIDVHVSWCELMASVFDRPELKIDFNFFLCCSECDCEGWDRVDYKFVTGLASTSATVVESSANSQQAGHDPPTTVEGDGADTKGVLHTCHASCARTPEIWKVLQ